MSEQVLSLILVSLLAVLYLRESSAFQQSLPPIRSVPQITITRWPCRMGAKGSETPVGEDEEETKKVPALLRLAELSLMDYDWRSSLFKSKEADRRVAESLARMMGDEPSYVRPMDASDEKIGPLVSHFFSVGTTKDHVVIALHLILPVLPSLSFFVISTI